MSHETLHVTGGLAFLALSVIITATQNVLAAIVAGANIVTFLQGGAAVLSIVYLTLAIHDKWDTIKKNRKNGTNP